MAAAVTVLLRTLLGVVDHAGLARRRRLRGWRVRGWRVSGVGHLGLDGSIFRERRDVKDVRVLLLGFDPVNRPQGTCKEGVQDRVIDLLAFHSTENV